MASINNLTNLTTVIDGNSEMVIVGHGWFSSSLMRKFSYG